MTGQLLCFCACRIKDPWQPGCHAHEPQPLLIRMGNGARMRRMTGLVQNTEVADRRLEPRSIAGGADYRPMQSVASHAFPERFDGREHCDGWGHLETARNLQCTAPYRPGPGRPRNASESALSPRYCVIYWPYCPNLCHGSSTGKTGRRNYRWEGSPSRRTPLHGRIRATLRAASRYRFLLKEIRTGLPAGNSGY